MSVSDAAASPTACPALGWGRRLALVARDIRIAHSVFALPFAILAGVMAFHASVMGGARFAGHLALIVICMVLARTWAMLVNRIADRRWDRDNERTMRRAIASGALRARDGALVAGACAIGFILTCAGFLLFFDNPWPLMLCTPVLGWIALYSFTKRFTALCHLFLGGALAVSPLAAVIAVDPPTLLATTGWAVAHLAGFVLLWVAGFDIAYALQDLDFDRASGLHSIPARLGWRRAMVVSRVMHGLAFAALLGAWWWAPAFGLLMLLATLAVGGLLVWEHVVIARRGIAGIPMAFFTINGVVSVLLGLTGCADVLL